MRTRFHDSLDQLTLLALQAPVTAELRQVVTTIQLVGVPGGRGGR